MAVQLGRIMAAAGLLALPAASAAVASPAAASAAPASAVPFSAAAFSGHASGTEIHLGALSVSGTTVSDTEEGFSAATTSTAGLGSPVLGDDGGLAGQSLLLQPALSPSAKAFGTGAGLEQGLAAPADASADQLKLAGLASATAPPDSAPATDSLPSAGCPDVNGAPQCLQLPAGLASAGLLTGRGAAIFDPTTCPLGQPISYGLGDAADAALVSYSNLTSVTAALKSALSPLGISVPTTGNVVTNSGDARTTSETYLSANPDGTFGLTTQADATIAPVSLNLLGAASLNLVVGGALNANGSANPAVPISLASTVTGESSGAEVSLGADDVVSLTLTVGGTTTTILRPTPLSAIVGQGGLVLSLDPQTLVPQLASAITSNPVLNSLGGLGGTLGSVVNSIDQALKPVTSALPNVSLGEIAIGTPPRAINSDPAAKSPPTPPALGAPSPTEGTAASAAFDLARVSVAPSTGSTTTVLADLYIGHLEAAASLAAPIACSLPVVKSADPTSVTAGQTFTYDIQVPDPAKLALLDCNLVNLSVTDDITDYSGAPTFTVTGARVVQTGAPGTIDNLSPTHAVVSWTGLSYVVAPNGQPPNPPIQLSITVAVPSTSPPGVIKDVVQAVATAAGCQGGVSGIENLGVPAAGVSLTGSFTLDQPAVTATPLPGSPVTSKPSLPFTGAMGGWWQPAAGLAVLGGGAGMLALVRRARRRA